MSDGTPSEGGFLLVPVGVEALLVGADPQVTTSWVDLTPRFEKVKKDWRFFERDLIGLFKDHDDSGPYKWVPQPGIHLHWSLPRALTHASEHGSSTGSGYPRIPNRWLVQRLFWKDPPKPKPAQQPPQTDSDEPPQLKMPQISAQLAAWIIESDAVSPGNGSDPARRAVTILDVTSQSLYSRLGRWRKLPDGGWSDQGGRQAGDLTALGWGHPAFAAYYPACKSVLGFHDPAPPVVGQGDHLAYQVVGWYHDPDHDPLHGADEPAAWQARLSQLRWWCGQEPTSPAPTRTLCHGAAVDITWKGQGRVSSGVPGGQYDVALGSSSVEGLSRLLADGSPLRQTLLEALQYGILGSNIDPGRLAEEIHLRRYVPRAGGANFEIRQRRGQEKRVGGKPPEIRPRPPGEKPPEPPRALSQLEVERSSAPAEVPEDFQTALANLNAAADEADRARRRLAAARQKLYAEWCLWTQAYFEEEAPPENAFEKNFLNLDNDPLSEEKTALATALADLKTQRGELERDLAVRCPTLEVVQSSADPFYEPNDPAVVVAGKGLTPPARYARPMGDLGRYCPDCNCFYGDQELRSGDRCPRHDRQVEQRRLCRLSPAEALAVTIPNTELAKEVRFFDLFRIEPSNPAAVFTVSEVAQSLLFELLGLHLSSAEVIALKAYALAEFQTTPHLDRLVDRIKRIQGKPYRSGLEKVSLSGAGPAPPWRTAWERNPWIPLLLQWQVEWAVEAPNAGAGWSPERHWKLSDDEEDFVPANGAPAAKVTKTFQGWTMLNPDPAWILKRRLAELAAYHPQADLATILAELSETEVVSQALGGFGDRLLQLESGLWMQPINPAYAVDGSGTKVHPVDVHLAPVAGENGLPALMPPNPQLDFLPLRAGALQVTRLWIVDAFGQTLKLREFGQATRKLKSDRAVLPPRLSQPARLLFDWIRPDPQPTESPVRGWIVPNHLDKSFLVYDARGENLGAVQKRMGTATERAFFWVPAPGDDAALGGGRPRPPRTDPVLSGFLTFVLGLGWDQGQAFYTAIDELLGEKHAGRPEDDPLLSILVGRPLALAQARVGLELEGPPARQWSNRGSAGPASPPQASFPLRLGDAPDQQDGLVGWLDRNVFSFARGQEGHSYAKQENGGSGGLKFGQELAVSPAQPLILTLLLDPEREIAVRTGVLPVRRVGLPPRSVSASAAVQRAFFLAAPVLGSSEAPRMPVPSDDFGQWSWAVRPEVTLWRQHNEIQQPDAVAAFPPLPQQLVEGWLTLRMNPVVILSFWLKQRPSPLPPGAEVILTWKLQGAELIALTIDGEPRPLAAWSRLSNPPTEWHEALEQTQDPLWKGTDPPNETKLAVAATTTYVLTAADRHGNTRKKTLTVEVETPNGGTG